MNECIVINFKEGLLKIRASNESVSPLSKKSIWDLSCEVHGLIYNAERLKANLKSSRKVRMTAVRAKNEAINSNN